MKEKAKAHNAPHTERFDPPEIPPEPPETLGDDKPKPTGTGWATEEPGERPPSPPPR